MGGSSRTRLVGVVFVGFSLLFLAVGGYLVYEQEQALRSYESTEATVIGTGVDRDVDREVNEPDSVTYQPIVEYRYRVDGETYTAENVYPGGTSSRSDRDWAEGVVDDYRQGETVTAYYNPGNPGEAYLVKQRDLAKFAFVLLPLGFIAIGLLVVWRAGWAGDDDTTESLASGQTATTTGDAGDDGSASASSGPGGNASGSGPGREPPDASDDDGPASSGSGEEAGVEYGDWGGDGERE